jgi:hypothetical protein
MAYLFAIKQSEQGVTVEESHPLTCRADILD